MPYDGEYATYRPLHRISESQRVKNLLARSKLLETTRVTNVPRPVEAPAQASILPRFVLAIDGSYAEVDVKNGYPGAKVGYCTAASVLLDLHLIGELDAERPIDPVEFRKTEQAACIDAALPGSNVVTRRQNSARASFREELYDLFTDIVVDEDDRTNLLSTYEALLALKPTANPQHCPYKESHGCTSEFAIGRGCTTCPTCGRPVYSTDALRIHERFREVGTNGEAFGLVMQVLERLLAIHFLRCFERRNLLQRLTSLAFFIDGPLAAFGPPAWLSAAISRDLKRLNQKVQTATGHDLLILGIEKTGAFAEHFQEIDRMETPGQQLFSARQYMLLTDGYIKERVLYSDSHKRYGEDTYFGRKFFYKTQSGARIVASIPFLSNAQDTIDSDDISLYPQFATVCTLLDRLASSQYANAVSPLIAANAHAAIPLQLGSKVLTQLARMLLGTAGNGK
ncbi:DNA double-strand break repair nuclease NurA [Promineifilum sp.]|uniref:DNA double-strand break repair nuclease NurA n=1 Tax=Promineifilum sp. TaxID=2664178 RepID=UPI0035AED146